MGLTLENYIKDIFAETLYEKDEAKRNLKISQTFSYGGNSNNPPDLILKNGDAIEVKKIENKTSIDFEKYYSFNKNDIKSLEEEINLNDNSNITEVKIKNPNNVVQLIDAKLITIAR